jgi:hypothetical protein
MNLTPKLQLALDACKAAPSSADGEICFRWISDEYKDKGVTPQQLQQLAGLGVLVKTDQNKRGIYYRVNPN